MWWPQRVALSLLIDSSLVLWSVSFLLKAWGSTCRSIRLHRWSSSSRMAHPFMQSQEVCLPAQSKEHGQETRGSTITWREVNRAVEVHQPSSRTGICCFVWRGTGGAWLESYKMTSSRLMVCMFLTKLSETDSMRVAWGPSTVHLRESPRMDRSSIGTPFSSQMGAGSQWARVTGIKKESADAMVNVILPVSSSSMASLAVDQWWSG